MSKFYVYRYVDPRDNVCRYVGKGYGKRAYIHLMPSQCHNISFKGWICNLKEQGMKPIIEFICKDQDEEFCFFCEEEAIQRYGRLDKGTGTLFNHTNGGEGQKGFPPEVLEKMRQAALARGAKPPSRKGIAPWSKGTKGHPSAKRPNNGFVKPYNR